MSEAQPIITPLDAWMRRKIELPTETPALTRQALDDYQLVKLQATLERAYRFSPFYRQRLSGWAAGKLTSLSELSHLPFTTAEDLRSQGLQMLCVSQGAVSRVVTLESSGTTGNTKRLYFTGNDQELTVDFFQAGMATLTNPGERVVILLPGERPGSVGDLLARALERLGAIPLPYGLVKNVPQTLRYLAQTQAEVAVGIPLHLLALAKFYAANPAKASLALQRILLSTDYLAPVVAGQIGRIWNCTIFDHYGMTEMGLGGGVDCSAHQGYHLREADLLFEIVDPVTGTPQGEGESGEVVFTTLTREGMPLIRYRTGDISRWLTGRCACGTELKRLEKIRGRHAATRFLAEGCSLTMGELDQQLLGLPGVLDFTATLEPLPGKVQLTIEVQVMTGGSEPAKLAQVLDQMAVLQQAKALGKLDWTVAIMECDESFIPGVGKRGIKGIET